MRMFVALALVVGCIAIVGFWLMQSTQSHAGLLPYDDPVAVARGKEIYAEHCASCHGKDLQGEPDWQTAEPDGKMPAPPHDQTGHSWHHADAHLIRITREGTAAVVGGGYESDMIGFADVLSKADILAVLGYIKSTWPPEIVDKHNDVNRSGGH